MTASPADILIRPAQTEDAPAIVDFNIQMALETESKSLDPETVREGVEQGLRQTDKCRFFVAEINGQVVGQAMITYEWSDWDNGDLWWFQSVYVHPDYRRKGVFTKLYQYIETLVHEDGRVRGLRLYVKDNNTAGQAVYKKLGMSYTGYHVYEREY